MQGTVHKANACMLCINYYNYTSTVVVSRAIHAPIKTAGSRDYTVVPECRMDFENYYSTNRLASQTRANTFSDFSEVVPVD